MNITIEMQGIADLQQQLTRLSDVGAVIGPPLRRGGNDLLAWVATYPAATAANRPGPAPSRWYERGKGSMYLSKRTGATRVLKSSEILKNSWSIQERRAPTSAVVVIGTRVSYARYVHDSTKQARFHAARGWRTVQAAIQKFEPRIVSACRAAIAAALK